MRYQELFNKIYNQNLSDINSAILIKKEKEKYPYFGIAHFFSLKLSNKNQEDYQNIASKTALHFNNNILLNSQLDDSDLNIAIKKELISNERLQDELLFEPLYTTDYFASQGIKISDESLQNDKLGQQLKSFTDWLKTIKKTHGEKLPENTGQVDPAIQRMAENSNIDTSVITESMAEVFIQQGKINKAINIYQKLSLQNPSKSLFFADKIESLKEK